MKTFQEYSIQFSGLKPGKHEYEFEIGNRFFEDIEYSEIKQGKVDVSLELDKHSIMLVLVFKISGEVKVTCDRCADEFFLPIEDTQQLIVKFGDEAVEESEDVIVLPRNEKEINLSQYIYEYIILALPTKRLHPEGKCNKEAIKKLKNLEKHTKENQSDPRWDGLKNIKLN